MNATEKWSIALTVPCPACQAPAGVRCTRSNGATATEPHNTRLRAATPPPGPAESPEDTTPSRDEDELHARSERMKSRIAKLLQKAEDRGVTAEEATAFMAKAEQLMLEHAIDRGVLTLAGKVAKEPIVVFRVNFKETSPRYFWPMLGRNGSAMIVEAAGLVGIAIDNRQHCVVLYGTEEDCQLTATLLHSVWRQAIAHLKIWKRINPTYSTLLHSEPDGLRRSWLSSLNFLAGFCQGVAGKIRDKRIAAERTQGAELVLVAHGEDIRAAMAHLRPGTNRVTVTDDVGGWSAGYRAGQTVNLGDQIEAHA